jgi:hypothetical protein
MTKIQGATFEFRLREARQRMHNGFIEGELYESSDRLRNLQRSLESLEVEENNELYRYFPVAAISALETHFRVSVAAIINSDPLYLERAFGLLASSHTKGLPDLLLMIQKKAVSTGDWVAFSLPCSSIGNLESTFGTLFGSPLKELVSTALDPYKARSGIESLPIVEDVRLLWKELEGVFQQRHILAHEAASKYAVSFKEAQIAIQSIKKFTTALNAILWATVWKKVPLTQHEMNLEAIERCKLARNEMASLLWEGLKLLKSGDSRRRLCKQQIAWRSYVRDLRAWESESFIMGSIRPLIEATSEERVLRFRIEELSELLSQIPSHS